MIPYFELREFQVGFLSVQVWGLMVAAGILVGAKASEFMLRRRGLDGKVVWEMFAWLIVAAFVCARLFHVLFYEPSFFFSHPLEIVKFWHGGLSIVGGFIGAAAVGIVSLHRKKLNVMRHVDAIIFGLPLGLFIGRIGCFLIHDHPGKLTNFFLGVRYPDGSAFHDLGLYLSLNGLAMFLTFLVILKFRAREGMFLIIFLLWYGAARFLLDFLRANDGSIVDARYLGLTPAQYFSIAMFALGILLWRRFRSSSLTKCVSMSSFLHK